MTKIAINGFGRIGRMVLRAILENNRTDIEVVAINDLAPLKTNAHLLKYDSVHGVITNEIVVKDNGFTVDGKLVKTFSERNPEDLPWGENNIDIVMECTGIFRAKQSAGKHIKAGAKQVIISAPGESDIDLTVVYGINHQLITKDSKVFSNASCTTNCLAPVAKTLNDLMGIKHGNMTTIHSYTGDQPVLDIQHKDLHRARAAALSMIPTSTGAAKAVGLVLPELKGKLDGQAVRVPTPNVSLVDLTFVANRATSVEEINNAMIEASKGALKGVLAVNNEPLVSSDFNHNPNSSIFDLGQTKVTEGTLCRVVSWYDNEWGFANRMVDVSAYISGL